LNKGEIELATHQLEDKLFSPLYPHRVVKRKNHQEICRGVWRILVLTDGDRRLVPPASEGITKGESGKIALQTVSKN
jgi:hypothetical protein